MTRALPFGLLIAALIAGCGHAPPPPTARVYTPARTKADLATGDVPPVYVRLASASAAVLERATDDGWGDVCAAPCDGYVPAFGRYRVARAGHDPSAAFTLPGPPGTWVTLKVDDDGYVWTRDSMQLRARRAQADAAASLYLVQANMLRR
jgi:hypothetical protein